MPPHICLSTALLTYCFFHHGSGQCFTQSPTHQSSDLLLKPNELKWMSFTFTNFHCNSEFVKNKKVSHFSSLLLSVTFKLKVGHFAHQVYAKGHSSASIHSPILCTKLSKTGKTYLLVKIIFSLVNLFSRRNVVNKLQNKTEHEFIVKYFSVWWWYKRGGEASSVDVTNSRQRETDRLS